MRKWLVIVLVIGYVFPVYASNYYNYGIQYVNVPYDAGKIGIEDDSAKYQWYSRSEKQYSSSSANISQNTMSERQSSKKYRKYFLSHPFFQPTKGRVGSVSEISYDDISYNLDIDQTVFSYLDPNTNTIIPFTLSDNLAKWNSKDLYVKEDLSVGITDNFALLGMIRYADSRYKLDWNTATDDKADEASIDVYGLGLQWRFVDTSDWIAILRAYYQRQKDLSNNLALELSAGCKYNSTTIYGFLRTWYLNFDEDVAYGNAVGDDTTSMFFVFKKTDGTSTFAEGGLGAFSVLSEDWTFNIEANIGYYDWHNQVATKLAFGWQPIESFALNLYGRLVLHDSADGQKFDVHYTYQPIDMNLEYIGTAQVSNWQEYAVGAQMVLYF